ncbi:MAG: universal stress protein [Geminicoccaceae bacterium]|nr:universal stress protein [Geminicoccaceae bacterium]MCB2011726.1 universal stress protein [Geminicoccaceae bacterium]
MSDDEASTQMSEHERVFLVVVDETDEMRNALRFACRRAEHTNGRVALLYVIEPVEFQHWIGVGRVMEEEARQEAEQRVQSLANEVYKLSGTLPAIYIREGNGPEELLRLLDEDHTISLLVLGMASDNSDPGPLVSYLTGNMGRNNLSVPLTLVPGQLTEEQIDRLT